MYVPAETCGIYSLNDCRDHEVFGPVLLQPYHTRRTKKENRDFLVVVLQRIIPDSQSHGTLLVLAVCSSSILRRLNVRLIKVFRIQLNWQVRPLPSGNCTYRPQNFIILVIFNVMSDAALMSIPFPILRQLRISKRRKLGVSVLLSSGVFVIATAVVRVVLTLTGDPTAITVNLWGFRELGFGLIAVTAPIIYPLFTTEFWRPGPYVRENRQPILQPSIRIPTTNNKDDIELQVMGEGTVPVGYTD